MSSQDGWIARLPSVSSILTSFSTSRVVMNAIVWPSHHVPLSEYSYNLLPNICTVQSWLSTKHHLSSACCAPALHGKVNWGGWWRRRGLIFVLMYPVDELVRSLDFGVQLKREIVLTEGCIGNEKTAAWHRCNRLGNLRRH